MKRELELRQLAHTVRTADPNPLELKLNFYGIGVDLQLFVNNLLPVFLVSGAGYMASRYFELDVRTVSEPRFLSL